MPSPWFIVLSLVLLVGGAGAGFVGGLTWESNKRDAEAHHATKDSMAAFMARLERGKEKVHELIEWKRKARIYYLNWQKELSNVPDTQLAECETAHTTPGAYPAPPTSSPGTVVLSADFIRLYNDAWLPTGLDAGDTGGAAAEVGDAGTPSTQLRTGVTPREVLENTKLNAESCGEDRKRLDKLIDQITGK